MDPFFFMHHPFLKCIFFHPTTTNPIMPYILIQTFKPPTHDCSWNTMSCVPITKCKEVENINVRVILLICNSQVLYVHLQMFFLLVSNNLGFWKKDDHLTLTQKTLTNGINTRMENHLQSCGRKLKKFDGPFIRAKKCFSIQGYTCPLEKS
mgnify:CR=1 FL=1